MRSFFQLPQMGSAMLISLLFVSFVSLIFIIFLLQIKNFHTYYHIVSALLLLMVAFELICLMEVQKSFNMRSSFSTVGYWVGNLPWAFHALLALGSTLYCGWGIMWKKKIYETEITPNSIREALDNLLFGLSFSDINGTPMLTNRRMYEISREMTGHLFRNAEEFWQELVVFTSRNGIERVHCRDFLAFRWPNGSVWQFTKFGLPFLEEQYIQTAAFDITKLYNLTQKFEESNIALSEQQVRLSYLLSEIVQITQKEELLASKVKIHNELGNCILASRRFLEQKSSQEIELVLELWQRTIKKLEGSTETSYSMQGDTLQQLIDAAAILGCSIRIEGVLPDDEDTAYLLLTAMREAVTNAVSHAHADAVTVQIEKKEGHILAQISDNGTGHPVSIKEGGGLQTLRQRVERRGGDMKVICDEGVRLHLWLRLKEKEE